MSLKGNLDSVNLTEIFQMLSLSGREGTLFIYEGPRKRAICFAKEGVSIRSRDRNESNLLGKILVRLGRIDQTTLERALEAKRSSQQLIGDLLVEMGACEEADVTHALCIQSEEEIQELFLNRSDAQFEYVDTYFPETEIPYVDLNVNALLIEIARRKDEWEYIRRRIRGPREIYRFTGDEGEVEEDVLAECFAYRIDPLIDGSHAVGEIIDHSYVNKFQACKLLAAYLDAGVIEQVPPDAVRQNARLALKAGDAASALRHYEYLMTTGDYPLDVMAEAAEAHEANRDFAEAAALLRRLAGELVRSGDYRGAIDALRAVANYPRPEPEALQFLMELVFENPRAAAEFSGNIVEAGKTLTAYYVSHEQPRDAIDLLQSLLKTFPDEVSFAVSLVNVYYDDGHVDEAAKQAERLGNSFLKRKRPAHAVSLYKRLLLMDPDRSDIREKIRKIVSGKRRKSGAGAFARTMIVLAFLVVVGGVAVVYMRKPGTAASSGMSDEIVTNLFARASNEQTKAASDGEFAVKEYTALVSMLGEKLIEREGKVVALLRSAEGRMRAFQANSEKALSIAEAVRGQSGDREHLARANAVVEDVEEKKRQVDAARRRWQVEAESAAKLLHEGGLRHYTNGVLRDALAHFRFARELSSDSEWEREKKLEPYIDNIEADVTRVERDLKRAARHESQDDWTSARRIYLDLLDRYKETDLISEIRLPIELLSIPPGATIELDDKATGQKTPAIVRLDPTQSTKLVLKKNTFQPYSVELGPFGDGTQPAEYTRTFDLLKLPTWTKSLDGTVESDPAAWKDRVAVVERNGRMLIFDRKGKQVASRQLDIFNGVAANLTVFGTDLFVPTLDGKVLWFNTKTLRKRVFPRKGRPGVQAPAAAADGVLYLVDREGTVSAWDLKEQKFLWRHETKDGAVSAAPVIQGSDLVVVSVSGYVTVLTRKAGDVVIRYPLKGTFVCAPASAGRDHLVFASREGVLLGVARLTGEVVWSRDVGTKCTKTPLVKGQSVFVSPQPGRLIGINRSTGDIFLRYAKTGESARTTVRSSGRIFFATGKTLSAFAPRVDGYGLAWTFHAEGRILAGPVISGDAVYVVDENGNLYRLEASD